VPFLGRDLQLAARRERVHRRGDDLVAPKRDAEAALERWYRRQARTEIGARLDAATALHGAPYNGLTIRSQKTRWASCSSRGHMSLNWRLLLAPPDVLDYVVEHEVCHLGCSTTHRVSGRCSRRASRTGATTRWLRRYGATLRL
jgi:predicted metal-dependent hydrolase